MCTRVRYEKESKVDKAGKEKKKDIKNQGQDHEKQKNL